MATTILHSNSMLQSAAGANPTKKGGRRKALKDLSASQFNAASPAMPETGKDKRDALEQILSPSKAQDKPASKGKAKKKHHPASGAAATDVSELQAILEKLTLEKAKAEEQVRRGEELLRRKDEEIEEKEKEQEKLQLEMKKLQKIKGFNPILTIPAIQALKEEPKEGDESKRKKKKKNKKKGGREETIKKPCPAYVLYCKEKWAQVKEANPQAAFRDVAAAVGAKWKALSADDKKPYEERYQQEKEAYLKVVGREKRDKEAMRLLEEEQMQKTAMDLLQQYLQFRQQDDKETAASKTKKEKKDPLKPKQPMTAFFHYSSERRATLLGEGKSITEVAKIAAEEWKSMGEDKRAPFEEAARQSKEDYLRQMELYNQRKTEKAELLQKEAEEQRKILKQEALQLLKKKEKTDNIIKKNKEERKNKKTENGENIDPNKPKKPASSFLLFSKEQRKILMEERPNMQTSTLNAMISVRWKELAEAERQVWNNRAAEAMEAYKKEMEAYNKSIAASTDR